jgi:hypothetical protein
MVNKALVLKTKEESWSAREKCSAPEPREATRISVWVHHHKDLLSIPVNNSQGYMVQHKDSRLLSVIFGA